MRPLYRPTSALTIRVPHRQVVRRRRLRVVRVDRPLAVGRRPGRRAAHHVEHRQAWRRRPLRRAGPGSSSRTGPAPGAPRPARLAVPQAHRAGGEPRHVPGRAVDRHPEVFRRDRSRGQRPARAADPLRGRARRAVCRGRLPAPPPHRRDRTASTSSAAASPAYRARRRGAPMQRRPSTGGGFLRSARGFSARRSLWRRPAAGSAVAGRVLSRGRGPQRIEPVELVPVRPARRGDPLHRAEVLRHGAPRRRTGAPPTCSGWSSARCGHS